MNSSNLNDRIAHGLTEDNAKNAIALAMDLSMGYHPEMKKYWGLAHNSNIDMLELDEGMQLSDPKIGYTMKTFAAGFWALIHANSWWEGIDILIQQGGDADTNCAVAGALLVAKYGMSNIPSHLVDGLVYGEELETRTKKLTEL